MRIKRFQDPYNPVKTWVVKRYADRTFYLSQEIKGHQIYPFSRRTKAALATTVPNFAF